ncbi:MAG: hypothetical protein NT007_00285 [Candidatus Kapabacteria bacterium]|nr:hypothetical protein [Candidatus Kapabacteria bacterium]
MNLKILVNGIEAIVGSENMSRIIWDLPDIEKNSLFFHELAKSESFEVRKIVSNKTALYDQTLKLLLDSASRSILSEYPMNTKLLNMINTDYIEHLFSCNDIDAIEYLIYRIDRIINDEIQEYLIDKIIRQKDPHLKAYLAKKTKNRKILRLLENDKEPDVYTLAKVSLTGNKIPNLRLMYERTRFWEYKQ